VRRGDQGPPGLARPTDGAGAPLRVVINESGARTPNESALGKRIAMPWGDTLVADSPAAPR